MLKLIFLHSFCFASLKIVEDEIYVGIEKYQDHYDLPKLPYNYNAMEPWIDAKTMEIHHTSVHGDYTKHMNSLLAEWRKSGIRNDLSKKSILHIMQNIEEVPEKWKQQLKNAAGGYLNHLFYFATMSPNPQGEQSKVSKEFSKFFLRSFQNTSHFETWMEKDVYSLYGVGFIWLCRVPVKNYLIVYTTTEDINPLSVNGLQPVLTIDLWEHAYYMNNPNNRKTYYKNWIKTVDWTKVEKLFYWWKQFDPSHDEL